MRHQQHDRQPRNAVDEYRQEIERRGVGPVRILDQDQDRPIARQALHGSGEDVVCAPSPGGGVQLGASAVVDSEKIGEKGYILGADSPRVRDQRLEPRPPRVGWGRTRQAGPSLNLLHDRMQRTVRQMRSAIQPQDLWARLAKLIYECAREARLADSGFTT